MGVRHGKADRPRGRNRVRRKPRRRLEDYERCDHTRGAGRDLLGVDLD